MTCCASIVDEDGKAGGTIHIYFIDRTTIQDTGLDHAWVKQLHTRVTRMCVVFGWKTDSEGRATEWDGKGEGGQRINHF